MSSTAHSHHNYIKIFIILSVLTAVEIGMTFLGLPRTLLVALAGRSGGVESRAGGAPLHAPQDREEDADDRRACAVYSVHFPES